MNVNVLAGDDGYPLPGQFNIPHGMTLVEDKQWLCVADRENGRIQCFDLDGNFQRQYHPKEFGSRLFAVEFCPLHGILLFVYNRSLMVYCQVVLLKL